MSDVLIEARPRYATPRTPERRTRGPEVAKTAQLLGWELHPWQREALDVAMEIGDDGKLIYSTVVLLVPRRAGKTVLGLSALVHRAHAFEGRQLSVSNMQSGIDSRAMFRDSWIPTLEASEFAGTFTPSHQISHEQIRWDNGSIHSVRAPGPKAGVGSDLDFWWADELWALPDDAMEGAILPTMATRPDPQTWLTSMAGTTSSEFLIQKRDLGRELVAADAREGTYYLEYSAPEDADPDDESVWWACHPALGRTVSIERLRTYHQSMERDEFAQHFLGIWRSDAKTPQPITEEVWRAHREDSPTSPAAQITTPHVAIDVSPDRDRASVSVAGKRPDGRWQVEVIRNDEGTSWVPDFVAQVVAKAKPASVGLDSGASAAVLVPDLERALSPHRQRLTFLQYRDAARAAGALFSAFTEGDARHLAQPALDLALAGAQRKMRGDLFTWARVSPSTDLTPLVSCSLALWLAMQAPAPREHDWSIL